MSVISNNKVEFLIGILAAAIAIFIVIEVKGGLGACASLLGSILMWGGLAFIVAAFATHFIKLARGTSAPTA